MENKKLLDILFENRNKAYGAYELRTTEGNTLLKALCAGIGIVALGMGGFVYSNKTNNNVIYDGDSTYDSITIIDITPIKDDVVEPPKEEEKPIEIKREQLDTKQVKFIVPTPTESPKNEETVASIKETEKADLGAENREGTVESTGQIGGGDVSEGKTNVSGNQNTSTIPAGNETKKVVETRKAITASKAKVMAIFPGCEKEAKKGNEALTKCMSDKLSNELSYNLDDYNIIAERENVKTATAKMQFIVSKSGEITEVKPANGSDITLGKEAKKALDKINRDLKRKGKLITPAQYEDGTNADLIFSIPVRFQQL